jgi:hypothetical protein
VREFSGVKILEKLGIQNGVKVLDPVFLLSKSEWESISIENYNENFLLVYDIYSTFGTTSIFPEIAIKIAKEKSLKIWAVNTTSKIKFADKTIWAGPIEFLELVKSAKFVISNSFHGTAFSVIFQKDFYTIALPDSIDSETRITDFLESINILSRYIKKTSDIDTNNSIIYQDVNIELNKQIKISKIFLEKSLL